MYLLPVPTTMFAKMHQPRECEQTTRDQAPSPTFAKGKSELWLGDAVVARGEAVVDGVDARDEEPDGGQEAEAGEEVEEADLGGVEFVGGKGVDGLEVGVD